MVPAALLSASRPVCTSGVLDASRSFCCASNCSSCGGAGCAGTCCTDAAAWQELGSCALFGPPCLVDGTRELACELNGVLDEQDRCACRDGWTGETCGVLDLAPVAVGGGMREDGNSTWGFTMAGRMPWRDGKYHAIVAFITDHAGIESYGSHMGLAVATASVPEGPYTRPTDHLFGAVYAGNPSAAFDPVERRYVTMHQGCGPMPQPTLACVHGDPVMAMSGASPFGPWVEHGPVFNGSAGPFPQWDQWASNGALAIAGDGTAHLMYRSHAYTAGGLHFGERLGLATAHTWRGPFTKVRPGPILDEPNEDPFLWIDKRTGHFHAITHLERVLGRDGGSVGGRHLFSRDGVAWHVNTSHMWAGPNCPRPCSVPLDNGGTWSLQRRERPFILFDADGSTPRVVFSGVQLAEESAGAAEPRQPGRNSPQTFVMAQPVGRRGASRSGRRVPSASAATFSSVVNAAVPAPQLYASGDQTAEIVVWQ